jgi:hypothetical protein
MGIKDAIRDAMIIGLSGALLWHFSNIWRYGQHIIQEPNEVILIVETAGLLVIFTFGVTGFIGSLRRKGRQRSEANQILSPRTRKNAVLSQK